MGFIKRKAKRIAIDIAGYILILAALATGWLPGPGGIPLALAGLALLSINNEWARRLRKYLLENGGKLVAILFPRNKLFEWLYDILVLLLFALATVLGYRHAALWQVSIAIAAFFFALFIALMNRDRLNSFRHRKHKH